MQGSGRPEPPGLSRLLLASPLDMWRVWIAEIAKDPEMDRERIMRHIQAHVLNHMPNADAPRERMEEWLAGTYNLLAILTCALGIDPAHSIGVDLLMRKWVSDKNNHTPPPEILKAPEVGRVLGPPIQSSGNGS